ncbi:hypothetical protein AGMMS49938_02360 [Fibrobacterales bacterium]|nr:hypothetical protein AGMMS49938_02360 [Fibrobacterales bacterium]
MILYHGSNVLFNKVDLSLSKNKRDFGKGFYTTVLKKQAKDWAQILNFRHNGNGVFVYRFELNLEGLTVKNFDTLSIEWLDFVKENRIKGGIRHSFDVVQGPVANDKTMETVSNYFDGTYSAKEALSRLAYMKTNNQVSIHTEKALSNLIFIRREKWTV